MFGLVHDDLVGHNLQGETHGNIVQAKLNCAANTVCHSFTYCDDGSFFLYDTKLKGHEELSESNDCETFYESCEPSQEEAEDGKLSYKFDLLL
jgi:hypothetical protein